MCPPALPSPAGQGSLVQRPRLRDRPRLMDAFGGISTAIPTHLLRPLAQTLRCAPLARVVAAAPPFRRGRCGHRPLRRRSRLAARRMAEAREETGERHAGSSCPTGESPGRDAPSWFPALAPERIEIIFRRGVYVAKNTSQAASVENGRPNGAAILCAQSACAFIRPRQLCCLGRGNLSLKCSSVHFSELKYP